MLALLISLWFFMGMKEIVREGQKPPFVELELAGTGLGLVSDTQIASRIINRLKRRGLYRPDLLFCGVEGEVIQHAGTLGERSETFAVTEEQFLAIAGADDEYGRDLAQSHNPIGHALYGDLPAIVVFEGGMFDVDQTGGGVDGLHLLREGLTMDEAAVAVIYLPQ